MRLTDAAPVSSRIRGTWTVSAGITTLLWHWCKTSCLPNATSPILAGEWAGTNHRARMNGKWNCHAHMHYLHTLHSIPNIDMHTEVQYLESFLTIEMCRWELSYSYYRSHSTSGYRKNLLTFIRTFLLEKRPTIMRRISSYFFTSLFQKSLASLYVGRSI